MISRDLLPLTNYLGNGSTRHGRVYVMLSDAKHLLAGYTLSTVIPREHSDRGNLLADHTLSTVIARLTLSTVIPRLMLYSVIARLGTSRGNLPLLIANYSLLIFN